MPTTLGAHHPRVEFARELLSKKGRREHGRFSFEGPTLLDEALRSRVAIEALYATRRAYDDAAQVRALESAGTPVYLVDERTFAKLSDLDTPSGLLAVAPMLLHPLDELLEAPGTVLLLADLNDPGNAGTLLRSAEAFGVDRAIFGASGVEPYQPKVVRGAMGAIFRQRLARVSCGELQAAARRHAFEIVGTAAAGEPLGRAPFGARTILAVGSERHGLGPWSALCSRLVAIPMAGPAESLNAATAGSIALYEATKPG